MPTPTLQVAFQSRGSMQTKSEELKSILGPGRDASLAEESPVHTLTDGKKSWQGPQLPVMAGTGVLGSRRGR